MKYWALVVLALYGLSLVILTVPITALAFMPDLKPAEITKLYVQWGYWLWVGVMVLSQAALLLVPVKAASRRPNSRHSLLLPVLAAGLMMGGLVVGAVLSVSEFAWRDKKWPQWLGWDAAGLGALTWCVWAVVFFWLGRGDNPTRQAARQSRLLFQGSILELLVAVPTHIVARHRHYCCAGTMTFIGITLGLSVMLLSYGPAVFFLYADRWRRLHPRRAA